MGLALNPASFSGPRAVFSFDAAAFFVRYKRAGSASCICVHRKYIILDKRRSSSDGTTRTSIVLLLVHSARESAPSVRVGNNGSGWPALLLGYS